MLKQTKRTSRNPRAIRAEKGIKLKYAETEQTRQTIQERRNVNSLIPPTRSANNPYQLRPASPKTKIATPLLWEKSRREGVHSRGTNDAPPPNRFEEDFMTECNEEPTQVWQRR